MCPDALAAGPGGSLIALTSGGAELGQHGGAAWTRLSTAGALAATPAGRACQVTGLTAVAFGSAGAPVLAAGLRPPGGSRASLPTAAAAGTPRARPCRTSARTSRCSGWPRPAPAWWRCCGRPRAGREHHRRLVRRRAGGPSRPRCARGHRAVDGDRPGRLRRHHPERRARRRPWPARGRRGARCPRCPGGPPRSPWDRAGRWTRSRPTPARSRTGACRPAAGWSQGQTIRVTIPYGSSS